MNNGLYFARKTDSGVQSVYIDEDVMWFAHLNQLTRNRRKADMEKAAQKNRIAHSRQRAARRTLKWSAAMIVLAAAVLWAMYSDLIVPILALPAATVCLCIASCKIGLYFGRHHKIEDAKRARSDTNQRFRGYDQ